MRLLQTGFTLIEVLVVLTVMAILFAVAIPNYSDYVRRSQVVEGHSSLADTRVRMEQYYQDNRSYAAGGNCGVTMPAGSRFTVTCAPQTVSGRANQGYLITATGSSGGVVGSVYTIDHNNTRKTTQFKGQTVDKNCWLVRGGEC